METVPKCVGGRSRHTWQERDVWGVGAGVYIQSQCCVCSMLRIVQTKVSRPYDGRVLRKVVTYYDPEPTWTSDDEAAAVAMDNLHAEIAREYAEG